MRVLLLAGSGEARTIARELSERGVDVIASLAGVVKEPLAIGVPTRIGGFGGHAGFVAFLEAEGIESVVDATHPFAAHISARTHAVCTTRGLPYLRVERPGWVEGPGDRWVWIRGESAAVEHIPPAAVVLLATGRQTLDQYAALAVGRTLYCRQIDPSERLFPFSKGGFVIGRPPFAMADEIDLFVKLGVDWIIAKDAGGAESRAKLDAARELGIGVLMIRRPVVDAGPKVETVAEAVDWVARL
ncbi:MAG: cobalt-precorrin-6A reductase [Rhodobacterales bacterium]|nr:cobalt-precorrin-6A reductase [Rhodobacterales bacterium]